MCRSSKVSADRPCVELGQNARPFREGMVVLCFNCAVEVGTAAGMLSAAREEELLAEVAVARAAVDHANAELEAFSALRSTLDRLAARAKVDA